MDKIKKVSKQEFDDDFFKMNIREIFEYEVMEGSLSEEDFLTKLVQVEERNGKSNDRI